jgi:Protein of unknown function (DUF1501)
MNRRSFLSISGMSGLSMLLPWGLSSQARADTATFRGPYFLHMHAAGGWDPTLFCDAKLTESGTSPSYENRTLTKVGDVNGIPVGLESKVGKFLIRDQANTGIEDPQHFFQNAGKGFLVLNGVDTQTNNHETGVQGFHCGHNDIELPALAALYAGMVAKGLDVPMAFLAGGQYNRTGDVVGTSRFPGDKIPLLVDPFRGGVGATEPGILSEVASKRILELRNERLAGLESRATLPREKRTLKAFRDATRGGDAVNLLKSVTAGAGPDLAKLNAGLSPDTRDYLTLPTGPNRTRFTDLGAPLETLLRCFAAGVSISATYAQGGFDTHAQHDVNQQNAMGQFIARIRYVALRAEQLGISDKLYIVVTSDFGRTPRYNTGDGKDHWNVTSMLVSGPNIRGGRAIGQSDSGHKSLRILPSDVSRTVADSDDAGIRMHPSHIHREMRRVLGVDKAPFIKDFPLSQPDKQLPLLV